MLAGRFFAQLMEHLPLTDFRQCVARYRDDYRVQSFRCLDQFLTMAFAQHPAPLCRVRFYDADQDRHLTFLTNAFDLSALTVAALYKSRWQVELFFKWIKQHLRITAFYGISRNAVETQVWIAISVYVLAAILRKRLSLTLSPYTVLQILDVSLFEKTDLVTLLIRTNSDSGELPFGNQLSFIDL